MVKRSRKYLSRGQIRRRRQLREQSQRSKPMKDQKYVYEEFALWPFLKKHIVEILFICVLSLCAIAIVLLRSDQKVVKARSDSVSSLLPDRSLEWGQVYPHGYKIIAFTDKNIIHTAYDTLPEELEINWKSLSVARIQTNRLRNTEEKIRIKMAEIHYPPAGVSDRSITVTLLRQKGATATLTQLGKIDFIAKILEDREGYLFCLLGLKVR